MSLIQWSPQLSLGVPLIDDQHKQLITIANVLIKAVGRDLNTRVINNVIRRLREYTVFHFSSEEELMEKVHYTYRGEHANEHLQLKQQVKEYQRSIYYKENPRPEEVKEFIKIWLLKHILESDRRLVDYIHAQEKKKEALLEEPPQPNATPE